MGKLALKDMQDSVMFVISYWKESPLGNNTSVHIFTCISCKEMPNPSKYHCVYVYVLFSDRLKEQREVIEDKRHSMVYDEHNVASLTIRETTQKDAGSYTCEASNDLGTVTTSGVLEIQGKGRWNFLVMGYIGSVYMFILTIDTWANQTEQSNRSCSL